MMKRFKVVLALGMVILLALSLTGCAQSGSIGILDVNKVMSDSPKVKAFQDQLNTKGQELTKQLEAEKAKLTPEQFQAKQEAAYKDFLQTKQTLEQQIDDTIKQATEAVAKEKKLSAILYKNGVAQGGVDVTQDVINKMQ